MFGLGAAIAGRVDAAGYMLGQAMVTASQVTAHYVNEYADVEPDRAVSVRTWFSGGSGVLVSGVLSSRVAWRAAITSSVVAIAAAAALALDHPSAALVGLMTLGVSWAYSMPPIRLLGRGWGELATSLVVAMAVPLIGVSAQGAALPSLLWWSAAALVPVHGAMMLAFEIPDLESDAAAGKLVLAVRIGMRATQRLVVALYVLAVAALGAGWLLGGLQIEHVLGAMAAIPGGVLVTRLIDGDRYQWLTTAAVGTFVLMAVGLLVGTLAAT